MFRQKVIQYINEKHLFHRSDKILVALSGGADSVALLRVLLLEGYNCVAAHCNFHLRGEESDRDEEFVQNLCRGLDVPLQVIHFDTKNGYASRMRFSSPSAILNFSSFFILGTASHSSTVPTRISSFSKSSNETSGFTGLAL